MRVFLSCMSIVIFGINLISVFHGQLVWAETPSSISDHIQQQIDDEQSPFQDLIASYYSKRHYNPTWIESYQVSDSGKDLLKELTNAGHQGLDPDDYGLEELQWLYRTVNLLPEDDHIARSEVLGKLEIALTKNFLKFVDHLTSGRIAPQAVNGKWFLKDQRQSLEAILSSAQEDGVFSTLRSISNGHDGYRPLKEALATYQAIQSRQGWTPISDGPLLSRGSQGNRVTTLRHRLLMTHDLQNDQDERDFNEEVEAAVRRFQRRHSLTVDGLVGSKTLSELNVPVNVRINQILLNLERRRWMPRELGANHIYVNIPDFMMTAYLNSEKRMEMRVIVGKPMSQTPIFGDSIEYVVFNPYWNVPRSIATEEILPKFLEDPKYLASKNYEIVDWDEHILEMDLLTEENLTAGKVRVRQKPGPTNALGLVKFMFPNDHAVYLHDTPADYLFDERERDFSHGCIRIKDPKGFAELLLANALTPEEIAEIFKTSEQEIVNMPKSIPVYIVYFTTWVDHEGFVNFREDIYGHDTRLWEALKPVLSNRINRTQNSEQFLYGSTNEIPGEHVTMHVAKKP